MAAADRITVVRGERDYVATASSPSGKWATASIASTEAEARRAVEASLARRAGRG